MGEEADGGLSFQRISWSTLNTNIREENNSVTTCINIVNAVAEAIEKKIHTIPGSRNVFWQSSFKQ